ncbi:hypothetical protein E4U55_005695 [Claviceps digitariae]|nr:hypothetical protein E4U55_005695 [Claviceps digitariae]
MEHVHGIDVSWMTQASPKDKSSKSFTSSSRPTPAPSQPRTIPHTTSIDSRNSQGTRDNKASPPDQNASPLPSPSNGTGIAKRLSRSGSVENRNGSNGSNGPNGTPSLQRRSSWFSNISAKLSGSANSPPLSPASPNQNHHSSHHLHNKESQQQHRDDQAPPSPSQTQLSRSPNTDQDDLEPIPPKLNLTRNAVLQHAAAKPEGNSPYTPAPPRSGQAGFLGVFRRLSSSGSGSSVANAKLGNGLVERKVLNVDQHRERCRIAELKEARLRRVSFCVDVEVAPMPKYADRDTPLPKTMDKIQKKKLNDKGEGNALKSTPAPEEAVNGSSAQPGTAAAAADSVTDDVLGKVKHKDDGVADDSTSAVPEKEPSKKKEKKKRSEEERKARKEKRRRLAEDNGTVPIEIRYDSSTDSSSEEARDGTTTPKPSSPLSSSSSSSSCHPTTNPARIYRRCCQLRETPILKKITEQLMDTSNANVVAGTVAKLDLTDYYLQLPDLITLGDYLAVVPVKEIILENSGLHDEGLRVILAGLLAVKMPSPMSRRKKAKHDRGKCQTGGVVERLVLKNNKLGPDGWKHISLFLYKCRSLKNLDISLIPFPRQAPAAKSGSLANGVQIPRSISDVFAKAVAERLGGSTLEMVNMGETRPSMEQLGLIIDGMIKCGVRRLGLAHNSLDAEGIQHVARYLEAGVCEGLDLGGNDLSEHVEPLARCLDENHLIWALSLANCSLTPSGLSKMLPALAKLSNFRFIDLSNNQDLFQSKPSALGLLRRYLPRMNHLKRIHLQDVNMSSEQAIALVEILPEVRHLAHINLLSNSELVQLANAKTEEAQEEACALYASLMAAARISSSLICVDIEVPREDAGEIVKAMAKQVVAYCLRNMERIPDANIATASSGGVGARSDTSQTETETEPAYPEVLVHLVGHDVLDNDDGSTDDHEDAPDEDYVIGGTGVVKALTCCLKNRSDDSRRPSQDFTKDVEAGGGDDHDGAKYSKHGAGIRPPPAGKAKDMSKHLLAGARKIRQRLQPALKKAQMEEDGDEMTLRKLVFLDETLQGIIKRFEDEFPDTREAGSSGADDTARAAGGAHEEGEEEEDNNNNNMGSNMGSNSANDDDKIHGLAKVLSESSSDEALQAHTAGQDSAVAGLVSSDVEEETETHATKAGVRTNSMLSRELAEEEGRVHRAGHRFRSGLVDEEQFNDVMSTIDDTGAHAKHAQMLMDLADDIGGELLEKAKEMGVVRAFKEHKEVLLRSMRESDPDYWVRFLEAQHKARENITAAASDKNTREA